MVDHLATRKNRREHDALCAVVRALLAQHPQHARRGRPRRRRGAGVLRADGSRVDAALRSSRAGPPTSSRSTRAARSRRAGSPAARGTRSPAVHSTLARVKSVAAAIGFSPCLRHSASARRMCAADVTSRNGSLPTSGGSSAASSEVSLDRASSVMRSRGTPRIIAVCASDSPWPTPSETMSRADGSRRARRIASVRRTMPLALSRSLGGSVCVGAKARAQHHDRDRRRRHRRDRLGAERRVRALERQDQRRPRTRRSRPAASSAATPTTGCCPRRCRCVNHSSSSPAISSASAMGKGSRTGRDQLLQPHAAHSIRRARLAAALSAGRRCLTMRSMK